MPYAKLMDNPPLVGEWTLSPGMSLPARRGVERRQQPRRGQLGANGASGSVAECCLGVGQV